MLKRFKFVSRDPVAPAFRGTGRVAHTPVLRVGLGFAFSCFVIPTGATALYAVAEWRDRGKI